jgi:DNA end-binding protein Ku
MAYLAQPAGRSQPIFEQNTTMRVLWKGAITFGLVTIPVSLYPATHREELKFRLLRAKDQSPVNYKRVAEADGKEVPWDEIVKGYEYEKGKFVILKDEDFARVDVEATQTVDIMNFVSLEDVDPLLFYKPYFLEVGKGGDKAYTLLHDALVDTGKIAIAKVVIRARQHLAAVKPQARGLMLELMHFPKELIDTSEFKEPAKKAVGKAEMQMARQLIASMTTEWEPEQYNDDYHQALEKLIEEKIEHGDKTAPKPAKKRPPTNVIDLVSVLQKSLRETKGGAKKTAAKKPKTRPAARKKAA